MEKKVNWENCKTNLQRLVAYWVKIEYRHLYENATQSDIRKIYGRWAKTASIILKKCNNNLELAKKILEEGRKYFARKKLNYTMETILRNIEKIKMFVERKRYDLALFNQYVELCRKNKTNIDETQLETLLNKLEKPDIYLENKIIEEKRKIKIDENFIKLINKKYDKFFGGLNG